MQERILIVDDDDEHQCVARHVLDQTFRVITAYNLAEAEKELSQANFDLLLLDVMLPDGDGFSFFAKLRTQENTASIPVIFVTSKGDTPDEAMGFSLGAEDYITKPVDPMRLKTRVEARLRLIRNRRQKELTICKGNIKLNASLQRAALVNEGKETSINLTPVEFKLLFHLFRHEDQVFSREQLLVAIWDHAAEVFDRTVDMHISKLRKKIELSEYQIKAVHGLGYRLSKKL